jgi:hypothetical protein
MSGHPPSVRVVEAVARAEGVAPTELSPQLSTVIDPDALDALAESGAGSPAAPVEIEFQYRGVTVHVSADSTVDVSVIDRGTPTADAAAASDQVAASEE